MRVVAPACVLHVVFLCFFRVFCACSRCDMGVGAHRVSYRRAAHTVLRFVRSANLSFTAAYDMMVEIAVHSRVGALYFCALGDWVHQNTHTVCWGLAFPSILLFFAAY